MWVSAGTPRQQYDRGCGAATSCPADSPDQTDLIADRLPLFIGAVVGLSFMLLLIVFRSVLVAFKAALMNMLSVMAAYGVIAVVADGGWLGGLIGIDAPTPVPGFIPVIMFAILAAATTITCRAFKELWSHAATLVACDPTSPRVKSRAT
jgi:uncharacterized membrane protein YdfJ with MMPL/SSD domain